MIVHFTHKNQTVQQQTTLFFIIIGPKNYRYYFIFANFTFHFSLALDTFSLPVEIGSLLLSHVLLKHNERIIVDTTVSSVCDAYFCIFSMQPLVESWLQTQPPPEKQHLIDYPLDLSVSLPKKCHRVESDSMANDDNQCAHRPA